MTAPARPVVWGVIPARYASTRFPGKPLALLAGKPMVQHVYERTRLATSLAQVIVATDDQRILQAVQGFGGVAVLTGDHPTGTDRVNEAVRILSAQQPGPDYVLNVQGDEPLIDPNDLERLIQGLAARPGAVLGTLVHALKTEAELRDPNIVKAVLDREGRALYFSRSPIPHPRGKGGLGWRHLGVYLFRRDFLATFAALPMTPLSEREQLEQLRALEHGHAIHCFPADTLGFGVDVPEQLEQMEAMMRKTQA
jgi:3-deoxy-manno-octulosonate cytidylyltransferase (CMP-KDO synthetase)